MLLEYLRDMKPDVAVLVVEHPARLLASNRENLAEAKEKIYHLDRAFKARKLFTTLIVSEELSSAANTRNEFGLAGSLSEHLNLCQSLISHIVGVASKQRQARARSESDVSVVVSPGKQASQSSECC